MTLTLSPTSAHTLEVQHLIAALGVRDLTDPSQGPHALQLLVDQIVNAATARLDAIPRVERSNPVVAIEDNYDRLGYRPDAISRDARYTRYVSPTTMLRSHTSAGIPPLLRGLATEPSATPLLLAVPGICHRRDSIDRLHTGTPHQLDVWLLRRQGRPLDHDDLYALVSAVVDAAVPGAHWRWTAAEHPYTSGGREVDIISADAPVEIAECGLIATEVLRGAGLDPRQWSGLALGMGLDRALMLRKEMSDIRLLRSQDERIAAQMLDLARYQEVSALPPTHRDISVAVAPGHDDETLGDVIRSTLADDADLVEQVEIISRTDYADLPQAARARLEMSPDHENLLFRLTLRSVNRTLTSAEANALLDCIMAALHPPETTGAQ